MGAAGAVQRNVAGSRLTFGVEEETVRVVLAPAEKSGVIVPEADDGCKEGGKDVLHCRYLHGLARLSRRRPGGRPPGRRRAERPCQHGQQACDVGSEPGMADLDRLAAA